jgi:hypothetical protein
MCKEARAALLAAAASNVAPVRNQRCAQASPATKAAPPVKRRFESSLARRLLTLGAERAYAPNARSGPRGQVAGRSRRAYQTPVHVQGASPALRVLLAAARAYRRPGTPAGAAHAGAALQRCAVRALYE